MSDRKTAKQERLLASKQRTQTGTRTTTFEWEMMEEHGGWMLLSAIAITTGVVYAINYLRHRVLRPLSNDFAEV